MIRTAALPLLALAVIGCQHRERPEEIPGMQCNANGVGALIGKTQSPEVEAEALRLSGAKSVRWLAPDSMATMDFRPDRLNLHLGTDGKIGSARCG